MRRESAQRSAAKTVKASTATWSPLTDSTCASPLFAKASADPAKAFLKANAKWLRQLRGLNDPKGVYLTCPVVPQVR